MKLKHLVLKGNQVHDFKNVKRLSDVHVLASDLGGAKGKVPEFRVLVLYEENA